jgi:hypothetical protein
MRMLDAFQNALGRSRHVLLTGSDCPSMTASDLWTAVRALRDGTRMREGARRFVDDYQWSRSLQPLVDFVRYMPVVGFVPLTIIWIGIGDGQHIGRLSRYDAQRRDAHLSRGAFFARH